MSTGLEPRSFYGRNTKVRDLKRKKSLEEAENRIFKKKSIDAFALSSKHSSIDRGIPLVYQVFSKQSDAIDFSKSFNNCLKVFAFETDSTGKRSFIVCHPERYWAFYCMKDPEERHSYEVIVESVPSKLYFDLEYKKKLNPELDSQYLVKMFKQRLLDDIKETFNIDIGETGVLDLDSSTGEKFSKHLIIDLVFKDNFNVGNYVKSFCSKIAAEPCFSISMSEKENDFGLFVDQGVYTKNRNFRLYLSSKFGKDAVLRLAENSNEKIDSKDVFLKSLITNCSLENRQVLQFGESQASKSLAQKRPSLTSIKNSFVGNSPFPEIDNYFKELVTSSGGYIRKWILCGLSVSSLIYEISGSYRYCQRVGRHHKSNNIRFIVDLNFGYFYQTCHDPDCKGFRSSSKLLPEETMPWLLINDEQSNLKMSNKVSSTQASSNDASKEAIFDEESDEFLLMAMEGIS